MAQCRVHDDKFGHQVGTGHWRLVFIHAPTCKLRSDRPANPRTGLSDRCLRAPPGNATVNSGKPVSLALVPQRMKLRQQTFTTMSSRVFTKNELSKLVDKQNLHLVIHGKGDLSSREAVLGLILYSL